MLGVISVVALVGLISLVIPILIHLFNPGKGRLVWVGNINLVRMSKKNAVTERRISRWLLLLLRLLIFTLITLLLAQTYFKGDISIGNKTLTVVSPQWLEQASESQKQQVLASGDEVIELKGKFSHWSELAQLDQQQSGNVTFEVYTTNHLAGFDSATKAQFDHTINWHTLAGKVERVTEIKKAIVVYARQDYARQDSQHLLAALETIKAHRLPGLVITQTITKDSQTADWIFRFDEAPLSEEIKTMLANGGHKKPDFANRLLDLMTQSLPATTRFVGATLSDEQIVTSQRLVPVDEENNTPLHSGLLLLLVLCWIGERYLAERADEAQQ
ncbi:MAG: BatA domain-containing protein [Algicola sp.]|nr:BatA domain-containing protein [Algicola sp.]